MKRFLTGLAACALLAAPAAAQQVVGTLPTESKISDLYDGQRFGTFFGWLTTGLDPVGVRAKSAPVVGIRYDVLGIGVLFDDVTVGVDYRTPLGKPPVDLNDHYTHVKPEIGRAHV